MAHNDPGIYGHTPSNLEFQYENTTELYELIFLYCTTYSDISNLDGFKSQVLLNADLPAESMFSGISSVKVGIRRSNRGPKPFFDLCVGLG